MERNLWALVALMISAGCASTSWVDKRLQVSEDETRRSIEREQITPLSQRTEERLSAIDARLEALPERFAERTDLAALREGITQMRSDLEKEWRQSGEELGNRVAEISSVLAQRNDLQAQLARAVEELNKARAEFSQHRATVDNRVSHMEAEAKEILAALTELDEHMQEFFYNEFKNLQRKRESLLAEIDLIDRLVNFLARREPISLLQTQRQAPAPTEEKAPPTRPDESATKEESSGG
ncbi:MAG: hypothetical protein AB1486_14860 [Planctomycetota bacterium]